MAHYGIKANYLHGKRLLPLAGDYRHINSQGFLDTSHGKRLLPLCLRHSCRRHPFHRGTGFIFPKGKDPNPAKPEHTGEHCEAGSLSATGAIPFHLGKGTIFPKGKDSNPAKPEPPGEHCEPGSKNRLRPGGRFHRPTKAQALTIHGIHKVLSRLSAYSQSAPIPYNDSGNRKWLQAHPVSY